VNGVAAIPLVLATLAACPPLRRRLYADGFQYAAPNVVTGTFETIPSGLPYCSTVRLKNVRAHIWENTSGASGDIAANSLDDVLLSSAGCE